MDDFNDFGLILQDFERPFRRNQLVLALQFSFNNWLFGTFPLAGIFSLVPGENHWIEKEAKWLPGSKPHQRRGRDLRYYLQTL